MSRILLVDDEPIILRTFASFLKSEGHETWTAARAAKAQSILRSQDIDVVVSDVIMPEMNGISLLELIARHWPEIRVILITGEPTPDTKAAAQEKGAFDYLVKPVSRTELCRAVNNATTKTSSSL